MEALVVTIGVEMNNMDHVLILCNHVFAAYYTQVNGAEYRANIFYLEYLKKCLS